MSGRDSSGRGRGAGDSEPSNTANAHWIGDRYEVIEALGQGGMAQVYRVRDAVSEVRVVSPDGRTLVRQLRHQRQILIGSSSFDAEIPAVIALRAAELVQVALLEVAAAPASAAPPPLRAASLRSRVKSAAKAFMAGPSS